MVTKKCPAAGQCPEEPVGHSAGGCGSPGIRLPQGHPEQSYIAHCLFWGQSSLRLRSRGSAGGGAGGPWPARVVDASLQWLPPPSRGLVPSVSLRPQSPFPSAGTAGVTSRGTPPLDYICTGPGSDGVTLTGAVVGCGHRSPTAVGDLGDHAATFPQSACEAGAPARPRHIELLP